MAIRVSHDITACILAMRSHAVSRQSAVPTCRATTIQDHARCRLRPQGRHGADVRRHPAEEAERRGVLFMMSGGWFSMWVPPEGFVSPAAPERLQALSRAGRQGLHAVHRPPRQRAAVQSARSGRRRSPRRAIHSRCNAEELRHRPGSHRRLRRQRGRTPVADAGHGVGRRSEGRQGRSRPHERPRGRGRRLLSARRPARVGRPERSTSPPSNSTRKLAESVSPLLHVTPDDPPTLLIHGDKDDLVKLDNSERILAAFEKEKVPCELIVIEGAGHGFAGETGQAGLAGAHRVVRQVSRRIERRGHQPGEAGRGRGALIEFCIRVFLCSERGNARKWLRHLALRISSSFARRLEILHLPAQNSEFCATAARDLT